MLFAAGSDTSRAAAASVSGTCATLRDEIEEGIRVMVPEVELLFDLRHQTASARICELHQNDRIEDSGDRRRTRSGRNAIMYRIKEQRL